MSTIPKDPPLLRSSLTGRQLLVVDDDKALLLALSKVLRSEGAKVLAAGSASEAVRYLSLHFGHIDLVLTDMRMPGTSGMAILSAVKSSDPEVPVIIMTAFATHGMREDCSAGGAFAFLEKPVDVATLLGTVNKALAG
ncbi:MAG: response regulator [Verrucomicrobiaceae bacterium]|nr:response regulator [Verrucomicrobiaceae bacterium]